MTEIQKVVGKVIKVSKQGWGFISSKEIEFTRIFFHWTALRQDTIPFLELKTGMAVEFTPLKIEGKGYRAVHVRVIEKPIKEQKEESDGIPEADVSILQK
jgi:''Cold-shock'' DNA-binding domain.